MDALSLLIVLAAAAAVALYIGRPLLSSRRRTHDQDAEERARLRADLEEILKRLGDIEQDRATGQLSEDESTLESPRLLRRAAHLMRQLEAAENRNGPGSCQGPGT